MNDSLNQHILIFFVGTKINKVITSIDNRFKTDRQISGYFKQIATSGDTC